MMGTYGQYVPNFTVPMHKMLGMPAEFMESMHNIGSTFSETSSSPLIQDSTQSYQQLATQMTQIGDFLGAHRAQVRQNPPPPPRPETPARQEEMADETFKQEYQEVEQIPMVARRPPIVLVNRN